MAAPSPARALPAVAYVSAFAEFHEFIMNSLDLFRDELLQLSFPIFFGTYIELVGKAFDEEAKKFLQSFGQEYPAHAEEIHWLATLTKPEDVLHKDKDSPDLRDERLVIMQQQRFSVEVCQYTHELLFSFLLDRCNMVVLDLLNRTVMLKERNERFPPRQPSALGGTPAAEERALRRKMARRDADVRNHTVVVGATGKRFKEANAHKLCWGVPDALRLPGSSLPNTKGGGDKTIFPPDQHDAKWKEGHKHYFANTCQLAKLRFGSLPPAPITEVRPQPSVALCTLLNAHEALVCVDASCDGATIVAGMDDSTLMVWRHRKGDKPGDFGHFGEVLCGHSAPVTGVSLHWNQRAILSSSVDGTARLWIPEGALVEDVVRDSGGAAAAAAAVDAGESECGRWVNVMKYSHSKTGSRLPLWDVAFAPFGHYFATASSDRTAVLWSTNVETPLRFFAGHVSDVNCVAWHPNAQYLATGSFDKTVRMWDVVTGVCKRLIAGHTGSLCALAFDPTGELLISGGRDEVVSVESKPSRARTRLRLTRVEIDNPSTPHYYHLPRASISFLYVRSLVWELSTSEVVASAKMRRASLIGAKAAVTTLSVSPDSKYVVAGLLDGSVVLWLLRPKLDAAGTASPQNAFRTKHTPIVYTRFLAPDLVLAAGSFTVPASVEPGESIVVQIK